MIAVKFIHPINGRGVYRTAFYSVKLGETILLDDDEAYRIVYDFPGCFEMIEEAKPNDTPPEPIDIKPEKINSIPSLKEILKPAKKGNASSKGNKKK